MQEINYVLSMGYKSKFKNPEKQQKKKYKFLTLN